MHEARLRDFLLGENLQGWEKFYLAWMIGEETGMRVFLLGEILQSWEKN